MKYNKIVREKLRFKDSERKEKEKNMNIRHTKIDDAKKAYQSQG